jgi:FkbM family methyltransferase
MFHSLSAILGSSANDLSEQTMLKEFVRGVAKRYSYEILGLPRAYAPERTLAGLLRQEQINLVLDVGANTGQFVEELLTSGYAGRIVSFEPLSSAHAQLIGKAKRHPGWTIADRTAVGAETGSVEIHVSGNSVSSSILNMLPSHSQAAPESAYKGTETVSVNRLDNLCTLLPSDRALLKIDVQGYERQVLEGASQILGSCRAVICEMSLVPLYEGQVLALELWNVLVAQGFDAWALESVLRDHESGRMLQVDGLFVRRI